MSKGSISIEALISSVAMLLVIGIVFSVLYGYIMEREIFDELTYCVLRENHHPRDDWALESYINNHYVHIEDNYEVRVLSAREQFPYKQSAFENASEPIVWITDTGSKYHKPLCPTVQLSLHAILLKNATSYEKCSICNP